MKKFLFLSLLVLLQGQVIAAAETEDQQACYAMLRENLVELNLPGVDLQELENIRYTDLKNRFSDYYRNLSWFGIDLQNPEFEMRMYTWGKETGYVHPPAGPYPTTTQADRWGQPAKQNIIVEEFIRDPEGNQIFTGCAYFHIESTDLMGVTRERYIYDGELMAAIKRRPDYKAWYNENISFDQEDLAFVTWQRLFIYPKSTQNEYFNRFDVLEGLPANEVESFAEVFELRRAEAPNKPEGEDSVPMGDMTSIMIYDTRGDIITPPYPNLMPVRWPENEIFPHNSYYQAIENQFPEFAKRLTIRGILSYEAMKDLIASRNMTRHDSIWNIVADTRELTKYYLQKKSGEGTYTEDQVLESYIRRIEGIENEVATIKAIHSEIVPLTQRINAGIWAWGIIFITALLLGGGTYWFKKRK